MGRELLIGIITAVDRRQDNASRKTLPYELGLLCINLTGDVEWQPTTMAVMLVELIVTDLTNRGKLGDEPLKLFKPVPTPISRTLPWACFSREALAWSMPKTEAASPPSKSL